MKDLPLEWDAVWSPIRPIGSETQGATRTSRTKPAPICWMDCRKPYSMFEWLGPNRNLTFGLPLKWSFPEVTKLQ